MGIARHSYEVKVFEPDPDDLVTARAEARAPRLRPLAGSWGRAEGLHLDRARKAAKKLVEEKSGRVIRSLSISKQVQTRANGPKTGTIVVVVHGPERSIKPRTMKESRHKRGLPKEIAK